MDEAHIGEKSPNHDGMAEQLEHASSEEHNEKHSHKDVIDMAELEGPNVHHKMNFRLFASLVAMSFLWVGSQIPLYLYGSVLPLIYSEIGGGEGRYLWMVIGYLVPNAALCPFVGALSDLFGRKRIAIAGQCLLILGPIVVSTSHTINVAIGGMVIAGLGAGLNELIALAGTAELVPVKKRGAYVGLVVFSILPFCPSSLWAQLIAAHSNWRYVGILVGVWNFIGLVLVGTLYQDPAQRTPKRLRSEILREIDYIGAFLSTAGVTLFMMGMQWGANQYVWGSVHVLVPLIIGIVLIIAFFIWEIRFAPFPMAPKALFSKDRRTMILILIITFFSGGNFFAMLLFWPTQVYNMYGADPVDVGIRTLPVGFGIIGGAVVGLVLIGVTKGRTTILTIFWCILMTGFTGAVSVARVDNLNSTVYPIVVFACIGVGAVIIPCSIIAQMCCPTELIGTITAITLSVRYIGGAVGFTAYYNVFYHKFLGYAQVAGLHVIVEGVAGDLATVTELVTLAGQAEYGPLKEFIATDPGVLRKDIAFDVVIKYTQLAFAEAYKWPYWISIAFGGICILCSFGLKDVRKFM
ncbi:Hypothetical protein R9X50_00151000 [Acrodontium crateriforme]|uniref:Major facilitator superfamily (MFS) profile domain-containing protein n=1 Tax=Acrodontium crateriforme TaxID=150365 RepID=A0AAQ3M0J5_9PEZI|nr:Hypothetical protein R9X50_00151000 [Acrodontium crateriforme]